MNKKKIIYLLMLVAWLGFIYGNSLLNGATSGSLSGGITEKIYNILVNMHINIRIDTLHLIIRKLAHITKPYIILWLFKVLIYI